MVEEIKAPKELLDMGVITQEGYDRKKREILDRPKPEQVPSETKTRQRPNAMDLLMPPPKPPHGRMQRRG